MVKHAHILGGYDRPFNSSRLRPRIDPICARNMCDYIGIQQYVRWHMASILIETDHDREMIRSALGKCAEMSGLSQGELEQGLRVRGDLDRRAALQLIELLDHLSALVGDCAVAQSKWLKTVSLDLGEVPLALLNTPDGIERLRDYLAGQRYRS